MMVNIRNIKRKYALLQIFFWKTFSNLASLFFLHYNNHITPQNLFSRNQVLRIKPSRFCIKFILKQFRCRFTPIFILVTDKENVHKKTKVDKDYKSYSLNSNRIIPLNITQNYYKIASKITIRAYFSLF